MTDLIDDPDKFVTVGKFLEPAEAQMAKGALESAGIECFLQGENANSLLALAFRARLLVHKHDEETARQILGSAGDELSAEEQLHE
jgi:Putative prokaryotic signal transducing protein